MLVAHENDELAASPASSLVEEPIRAVLAQTD
jgi:hypothetical protein